MLLLLLISNRITQLVLTISQLFCFFFLTLFPLKVRGVGTGGIVSTAFCLLYKLFTLKLTRKQVMGLITHTDSPYIRALGFMYIRWASVYLHFQSVSHYNSLKPNRSCNSRYTQPPTDLWDWFESFLDDEEVCQQG